MKKKKEEKEQRYSSRDCYSRNSHLYIRKGKFEAYIFHKANFKTFYFLKR